MKKTIIALFLVISSLTLSAQVHENKAKTVVAPGHATEKGVKSEQSESTKNKRKTIRPKGFFSFSWLKGSNRPAKASSNSRKAGVLGGSGTIPQSDMSAVQNTRKEPLNSTMRQSFFTAKNWDMGLNIGSAYAITDVSMNKDYSFGEHTNAAFNDLNFNFGFFTRYKFTNVFALQMGFDYAQFEGSNNLNIETTRFGSYRFENDIFEFSLKTELHIPYRQSFPLRIYAFTGLTAFFNDVTLYDNKGFKDNREDDYSQVQPSIPIGIGLFYRFNNNAKIGTEFGYRKTIFDYLDGAKGDHKAYDGFMLNALKISFSF